MEKSDYIFGLRAIIEAIEAGKDIDKILVKTDINGDLARELLGKAKAYGILVRRVPQEKLNRITMKNHQGAIAILAAVPYHKLDNIIPKLYEEGKTPLMVVLDGVTDIRNFGAIARTACCAGVDAIVIPSHNSVSITADAIKTSAGALFHIPVCREKRTLDAVRQLKDSGYKIVAATEKGARNYTTVDFKVPVAIVMGAEETGISDEVLRIADDLAAIPILGEIGSLNVSVAAGVMMYEAVRQRNAE
ncbi:MAG: 23S rRNA (guanosine(2251)-2'-O)-methyltransferase RlmB [Muribaculaceae bacterium]|nr:23S rRNA (guanosine(2251)-2'-O)-methyltransferase RlmB [Muribaculaceae bacterium]MDE6551656.1 23S rRNA (guanosine(2251)-2'-O)-methyltransferase RlmB [Muribaculaceae bacterium]